MCASQVCSRSSIGFVSFAEGQGKLKSASVLIIGAGGLGSPVGMYLAGAGVGKIGFVDFDVVEASNLHRQVMHSEERIGMAKVESAAAFIRR